MRWHKGTEDKQQRLAISYRLTTNCTYPRQATHFTTFVVSRGFNAGNGEDEPGLGGAGGALLAGGALGGGLLAKKFLGVAMVDAPSEAL